MLSVFLLINQIKSKVHTKKVFLMRSVFCYGQRFAPINSLQAFAQGVFYIVEEKKLTRFFEHRNWRVIYFSC